MGNIKTNPFNRRDYLRSNIAGLLQSETKGLNLVAGRLNALNRSPNTNSKEDLEKRQILERCLALFRSQKFKDNVKREKAARGILEQEDVTQETRLENLHKIAEYSEELTDRLCEIVLGDLKRKYNMSDKCTTGMLTTGAPVKLINFPDGLSTTAQDAFGTTISIQHIGMLTYDTPSATEYIYQYRVTKQTSQNDKKTYDVFSHIDLNAFNRDPEYRQIVMENLLSDNNIEFSNANGYIGVINNSSQYQKQLNIGEEIDDTIYYRYQISPEYSLEYDGEIIEAIRTYNRQQEIKQEKQQNDGR